MQLSEPSFVSIRMKFNLFCTVTHVKFMIMFDINEYNAFIFRLCSIFGRISEMNRNRYSRNELTLNLIKTKNMCSTWVLVLFKHSNIYILDSNHQFIFGTELSAMKVFVLIKVMSKLFTCKIRKDHFNRTDKCKLIFRTLMESVFINRLLDYYFCYRW